MVLMVLCAKSISSCPTECICKFKKLDCLKTSQKIKTIPINITQLKLNLPNNYIIFHTNVSNIENLELHGGVLQPNIFMNLTNLRQLDLINVSGGNNMDIFNGLSKLSFLNIESANLETYHVEAFQKLTSLSTMSIRYSNKFQNNFFAYLTNVTIVDIVSVRLPVTSFMKHLTSMKDLGLQDVTFQTSNKDILSTLLTGLENLINLHLVGIPVSINKRTFQDTPKLDRIAISRAYDVSASAQSFKVLSKIRAIDMKSNSKFILDINAFHNLSKTIARIEIDSLALDCDCQLLKISNQLMLDHNHLTLNGQCLSSVHSKRVKLKSMNISDVCTNSTCNFDNPNPKCYNEFTNEIDNNKTEYNGVNCTKNKIDNQANETICNGTNCAKICHDCSALPVKSMSHSANSLLIGITTAGSLVFVLIICIIGYVIIRIGKRKKVQVRFISSSIWAVCKNLLRKSGSCSNHDQILKHPGGIKSVLK